MTPKNVTIKEGFSQMDFAAVTAMLSRAHWSPGISRQEVEKGASHSTLVIGAFVDAQQVGYCRAISDQTRFAYIMDVFVDEGHRHLGIGQAMIEHLLSHALLADVYQFLLITRYAQGMYEKCGFSHISRVDDWMEIRKPRPKR